MHARTHARTYTHNPPHTAPAPHLVHIVQRERHACHACVTSKQRRRVWARVEAQAALERRQRRRREEVSAQVGPECRPELPARQRIKRRQHLRHHDRQVKRWVAHHSSCSVLREHQLVHCLPACAQSGRFMGRGGGGEKG
eukprot:140490-Chlamydomonas_euryale.AAC.3